VTISATEVGATASLDDPNGISMDKAGNITVANAANNTLAEFTSPQITSSGSPTPHAFVIGGATLLDVPTGLTYGPLVLK
jgi:hypothetical protein